jgi:hypothetical protein
MARQARDLQMTAGSESPLIITARACLVPPHLLAQPLSGGKTTLATCGKNAGADYLYPLMRSPFPRTDSRPVVVVQPLPAPPICAASRIAMMGI